MAIGRKALFHFLRRGPTVIRDGIARVAPFWFSWVSLGSPEFALLQLKACESQLAVARGLPWGYPCEWAILDYASVGGVLFRNICHLYCIALRRISPNCCGCSYISLELFPVSFSRCFVVDVVFHAFMLPSVPSCSFAFASVLWISLIYVAVFAVPSFNVYLLLMFLYLQPCPFHWLMSDFILNLLVAWPIGT